MSEGPTRARTRETWCCRALRAAAPADSPHSRSMRRSAETTWPALSASSASKARCFALVMDRLVRQLDQLKRAPAWPRARAVDRVTLPRALGFDPACHPCGRLLASVPRSEAIPPRCRHCNARLGTSTLFASVQLSCVAVEGTILWPAGCRLVVHPTGRSYSEPQRQHPDRLRPRGGATAQAPCRARKAAATGPERA